MFPLSSGKLIRLNPDGSNGDIFYLNKSEMTFGSTQFSEHFIRDIEPTTFISCEISTDEIGRVSIYYIWFS